jgi:hypothetical protein
MDNSLRFRAITLNLFLGLLITLATLDRTFCTGVSEVHCIQSEQHALLKIKQDYYKYSKTQNNHYYNTTRLKSRWVGPIPF